MPVPKYPPDGDLVTEQILERLLHQRLGCRFRASRECRLGLRVFERRISGLEF